MIYTVPTADVVQVWPLVQLHVEAACEAHPLQEPSMVLVALLEGRAQLFLLCDEHDEIDGCLVMEVSVYPTGLQVANVWLLGGRPGTWERHEADLEIILDEWSKAQGCDIIALLGRPGWQKVLSDQWQRKPLVQAWRKRNDRPRHGDSLPDDRRGSGEEPGNPTSTRAAGHVRGRDARVLRRNGRVLTH